ncbi:uncharacterized protein METZ01_LOCUS475, partial [marine metagenome]
GSGIGRVCGDDWYRVWLLSGLERRPTRPDRVATIRI